MDLQVARKRRNVRVPTTSAVQTLQIQPQISLIRDQECYSAGVFAYSSSRERSPRHADFACSVRSRGWCFFLKPAGACGECLPSAIVKCAKIVIPCETASKAVRNARASRGPMERAPARNSRELSRLWNGTQRRINFVQSRIRGPGTRRSRTTRSNAPSWGFNRIENSRCSPYEYGDLVGVRNWPALIFDGNGRYEGAPWRHQVTVKSSTPGRTRTCNLWIRSPLLYPVELRGQCDKCSFWWDLRKRPSGESGSKVASARKSVRVAPYHLGRITFAFPGNTPLPIP